jgi:hypothetical protein
VGLETREEAMPPCQSCNLSKHCRVPRDLAKLTKVLARLESTDSKPRLCFHIHRYVDNDHCLVDLGCADLPPS